MHLNEVPECRKSGSAMPGGKFENGSELGAVLTSHVLEALSLEYGFGGKEIGFDLELVLSVRTQCLVVV